LKKAAMNLKDKFQQKNKPTGSYFLKEGKKLKKKILRNRMRSNLS